MIIDLCVPYWGDPDDLRAMVRSVQAQTSKHWRLTVIDDGYPGDAAADFFASLADERIRYRRNAQNVGIVENFRRAVAAAEGPYVVVMGSDDLLEPGYIEHMRRVAADHPDADVIQPGVRVIDASGRPRRGLVDVVKQRLLAPRRAVSLRAESMARSLLVGDWLYWPSLMFRTESIRAFEFRDDLPIILDLAILLDIAFAGGTLRYAPATVFSYRRHAASASQKTILDGTRFDDEVAFYREMADRARRLGWRRARRAATWRPMSRLHGIAVLPGVLRHGTRGAVRAAVRLAFSR